MYKKTEKKELDRTEKASSKRIFHATLMKHERQCDRYSTISILTVNSFQSAAIPSA